MEVTNCSFDAGTLFPIFQEVPIFNRCTKSKKPPALTKEAVEMDEERNTFTRTVKPAATLTTIR